MPSRADPLSGPGLAAFVAAIEAGTVQGAAETLELTQSAVTKRIQALERRVGVPLFLRDHGGLQLTDAGRVLYPEARQALAALRHAADAVAAHRGKAGHELRLSASPTIGEVLLPGWLAAYRDRDPAMRAIVDIATSTSVLRAVRRGEAEIGFVEGTDPLDGVEARTLVEDELVVVITADHPWARRRAIAAADLTALGYVARETGSGLRAVADAGLHAVGVELVPELEMASTQGVKHALDRGTFALLSTLAVAGDQRAGTLRAVPLGDADLSRKLRAVRRARARRSETAASFWRWLSRAASPARSASVRA
ncbi:MAG: LysR family transcriptional regulator [Solirubrobacteraceae bacterium]|nr:LysR family transcriptional regulator [Solirubrobacteraceae bacterium]